MSEDDKKDVDLAQGDTELTESEAATELTASDTAIAEDTAIDGELADEVATPDAATATAAKRRSLGRVGALALAVLLLASAGVTAWLYFTSFKPDQQTGPAARDSALTAAKDGTVAVLSYTPDSLDKDLDTAKSHLTGDFLKYYSEFTDQVVRPAVKTKQVATTANVVRAAVSEMNPDQAKVLVFVNQTTTSSDRTEPSMSASSVVVTMNKIDGKWLISAFEPV